tara:strand:- start:4920 stop:5387 length:468 start_codon:yes stop_codon:yes gene_type:complete
MASEIRVNSITNRSGLTTTTWNDQGLDVVGVATAFNFKTGTTNVHNVGVEAAGINVLGADTPIGTGATIYDDGGARFSGIVTATSFVGSGANLTGLSSAEMYGFTGIGSHLEVRTTNSGADNITNAQYVAFEQVMFAASGISWSINNDGNLIATI